ncbi:MAG TPA: carboxylesterase/lipase family protein [Acidimicrobiales bacterium]|nr:carboxylesterase/lipase family protein [Acidimicrobiales bacterium]
MNDEGPLAQTACGTVRGRHRRGVQLFAGIPYAEPPVGDRRFAPPTPHDSWDGTRDALRFGKAAPQLPGEGLTNRVLLAWDEDCLTLNVVTPAADDARRPVYVWIHGGAYQHGQGATPWYDGTSFAIRGDIVVVTINYRLGALGFCHLSPHLGDRFASAGVNGFLDQLAALGWVRDNIAAFGGDPDRVTVGGESAGAFSVCNVLASPHAAGLVHRAIAQSGAAHNTHDPESGKEISAQFLTALGEPNAAELLEIGADRILEAQQQVIVERSTRPSHGPEPFYPVWGHEALPRAPHELIAEGAGSEVGLLTGTNEDEMALWGVTGLSEDRVHRYTARMSPDADAVLACYRQRLSDVEAGWVACAIATDRVFRIPAIRLAENRHANGAATWMYRFSWDSRAFEGQFGAAHALEIPFTFNTLDGPGTDVFLGEGPRPDALAETMHDSWIAFIRHGDPSTSALGDWPPYEPDHRLVMDLDDECGLLADPESDEREIWESVVP